MSNEQQTAADDARSIDSILAAMREAARQDALAASSPARTNSPPALIPALSEICDQLRQLDSRFTLLDARLSVLGARQLLSPSPEVTPHGSHSHSIGETNRLDADSYCEPDRRIGHSPTTDDPASYGTESVENSGAPSPAPQRPAYRSLPDLTAAVHLLESQADQRIGALARAVSEIESRVGDVHSRQAAAEPIAEAIRALEGRVAAISGALSEITVRIDAVQSRSSITPELTEMLHVLERRAHAAETRAEAAEDRVGALSGALCDIALRIEALEKRPRSSDAE